MGGEIKNQTFVIKVKMEKPTSKSIKVKLV